MADAQVAISRIGTETLLVPLVGTAPLIVNKFSEKAKRQMLDAMQGAEVAQTTEGPRSRLQGRSLPPRRRDVRVPGHRIQGGGGAGLHSLWQGYADDAGTSGHLLRRGVLQEGRPEVGPHRRRASHAGGRGPRRHGWYRPPLPAGVHRVVDAGGSHVCHVEPDARLRSCRSSRRVA